MVRVGVRVRVSSEGIRTSSSCIDISRIVESSHIIYYDHNSHVFLCRN